MKHRILFLSVMLLSFATMAQTETQRTAKGARYRILKSNPGPKIKNDDIVTFQVIQKTDKDSVLFDTYKMGRPVQIKVQPSQNVADLMEIFPLLANKDSAEVLVPTDSIFKGHEGERPAFLKAKSFITFLVKVEKVQSLNDAIAERNASLQKLQQEELTNTNQYITANKIPAIATASGLKYVVTKTGEGRKAVTGDTLLVNYTGRTLAGKVFDSSIQPVAIAAGLQQPGRDYQPLKVVLGQNQVIAGWEEGLHLLNEGSQATFIIPSNLAYGQQGAGRDIGPFSTLIFDLELVKLNPGKTTVAAKPAVKPGPVKKPAGKAGVPVKKKVTPK